MFIFIFILFFFEVGEFSSLLELREDKVNSRTGQTNIIVGVKVLPGHVPPRPPSRQDS